MTERRHERDIMMDTLLYSIMFYILSSPASYQATSGFLPKGVTDRVFLHTYIFGFAYVSIRYLLKR